MVAVTLFEIFLKIWNFILFLSGLTHDTSNYKTYDFYLMASSHMRSIQLALYSSSVLPHQIFRWQVSYQKILIIKNKYKQKMHVFVPSTLLVLTIFINIFTILQNLYSRLLEQVQSKVNAHSLSQDLVEAIDMIRYVVYKLSLSLSVGFPGYSTYLWSVVLLFFIS